MLFNLNCAELLMLACTETAGTDLRCTSRTAEATFTGPQCSGCSQLVLVTCTGHASCAQHQLAACLVQLA